MTVTAMTIEMIEIAVNSLAKEILCVFVSCDAAGSRFLTTFLAWRKNEKHKKNVKVLDYIHNLHLWSKYKHRFSKVVSKDLCTKFLI